MQDFDPVQPSVNVKKSNAVWKWVAIGCGGCLGLSVLMTIALTFLASRMMNFSVDPQDVETQAQTLFDYKIPGETKGILNMNIMGINVIQVTNTEEPPTVLLTVGKIPIFLQEESAKTSFIESFQESMADDGGYRFTKRHTENLKLCGQPVPVLIEEGTFKSGQSQKAVSYMATVKYNKIDRFAWVVANGDKADATAKSVFNSLKCK